MEEQEDNSQYAGAVDPYVNSESESINESSSN